MYNYSKNGRASGRNLLKPIVHFFTSLGRSSNYHAHNCNTGNTQMLLGTTGTNEQ